MNCESFKECAAKCFLIFYFLFTIFFLFVGDDTSCTAPIHIFLLLCVIIFPLILILERLAKSLSCSSKARNRLENVLLALMGPVVFCIGILGLIMTIINWSTPKCLPSVDFFDLWVAITLVSSAPSTSTALHRLSNWWYHYRNGRLNVIPYNPNREFDRIEDELMDEQEISERDAGLPQEELEKLERNEYQADSLRNVMREKTCSICCEDFEIGSKVVDVPNCLHTFHEQCIADWLRKNITCPMCRGVVRKPDLRQREQRNAQQHDLENGLALGV